MISSGESQDETNAGGKTATLFARRGGGAAGSARFAKGRGGRIATETATGTATAVGTIPSTIDSAATPNSVAVSKPNLIQDEESLYSESNDVEFSSAAAAAAPAAVYTTTADDSLNSSDVLPPTVDPDLVTTLPKLLPQSRVGDIGAKEDLPACVPNLPPDLQVRTHLTILLAAARISSYRKWNFAV